VALRAVRRTRAAAADKGSGTAGPELLDEFTATEVVHVEARPDGW
jgi:hypothetical protein